MSRRSSLQGLWSSRRSFVLAATGAAVGLGNIWKFPYLAGINGGGAYVWVYLSCILAIGLPIMIAEVLLGRRGRRNPIDGMRLLSEEETGGGWWRTVGWAGVATGILILSYYSVVAGWALDYTLRAAINLFDRGELAQAGRAFDQLRNAPLRQVLWHTAFMAMSCWIVAKGVKGGLERTVGYLMPLLFLLLLVMVGYAAGTGGFAQAVDFLFHPHAGLDGRTALVALGNAFFTLSLGMGVMMAYGAYLPEGISIGRSAIAVAVADTIVAVLAGLAIFPVVFAQGMQPALGPGLLFRTLPAAFLQMPGGSIFLLVFFILLVCAAWASSISLLEPAVAWLVERHAIPRARAVLIIGAIAWVIGFGTVFSFNRWADVKVFGQTIFQNLDFVTTAILLPLVGMLIALFAGWVMSKSSSADELAEGSLVGYRVWRFAIRFVAPLGIIAIVIHKLVR